MKTPEKSAVPASSAKPSAAPAGKSSATAGKVPAPASKTASVPASAENSGEFEEGGGVLAGMRDSLVRECVELYRDRTGRILLLGAAGLLAVSIA